MQEVLLVTLLAVAAVVGASLLLPSALGPMPVEEIVPVGPPSESVQLPLERMELKIATVMVWDSDVADIPLMLTGEPLELEFIIKFQPNLLWVSQAEGSANWEMHIERSNQRGEIVVRAKRLRSSPGSHRLLTLRFHRLEKANAALTIPRDTIKARFPSSRPYEVVVINGAIRTFS